jgi:hypothetical protein
MEDGGRGNDMVPEGRAKGKRNAPMMNERQQRKEHNA